MLRDIKKEKRQRVILDLLPFVYNLLILVVLFLDFNSLYMLSLGYVIVFFIVCVDLLFRSVDEKYCIWHRTPIYNMMMICGFGVVYRIYMYFDYNLLEDPDFPILFVLFVFWNIAFFVSFVFFFRKRIKKIRKRCFRLLKSRF